MPNATFFRLPDEKRERLLRAAEEEFTRASFAEASINRIVQAARIPRGSFYQYFEGKEDLFFYLLDSMRESYVQTLQRSLEQARGDVFEMPLLMFDQLIGADGEPAAELAPCVRILKLNQSMDMQGLLGGKAECVLPLLLERIDREKLGRQDEAFVMNVFHLLIFALVCSMMETLWDKNKRAAQRRLLVDRIDIIRNGSMKDTKSGGKDE